MVLVDSFALPGRVTEWQERTREVVSQNPPGRISPPTLTGTKIIVAKEVEPGAMGIVRWIIVATVIIIIVFLLWRFFAKKKGRKFFPKGFRA